MKRNHSDSSTVWTGVHARYRTTVDRSAMRASSAAIKSAFFGWLRGKSDVRFGAVIEVCSRGLSIEWRPEGRRTPRVGLVHSKGSPAQVLLHDTRTAAPLAAAAAMAPAVASVVRESLRRDPKTGDVAHVLDIALGGQAGKPGSWLRFHFPDASPSAGLFLDSWWMLLGLGAGAQLAGRPLPLRIELRHDDASAPLAMMELVEQRQARFAAERFGVPPAYTVAQPRTHRRTVKPAAVSPRARATADSRLARKTAPSTAFFSQGLPERDDVKLMLNNQVVDKLVNIVNRVSRSLGVFSGSDFLLNTSELVTQLSSNSPGRVQGLLAKRIFFGLLFLEIDALRKAGQAQPLLDAVRGPARPHDWRRFLDALDSDETHVLETLLTEPGGLAVDSYFVSEVTADLEPGPASLQLASGLADTLGEKWAQFRYGQLDLRPEVRVTQRDGKSEGWNNVPTYIKEGVGDVFDLTLSSWELALDFDHRDVLDLPVLVESDPFPDESPVANFRFGLLTRFRLAEVSVHCNASTTPTTDSPIVAAMIFFCPPCFLALWQFGFVDATVSDIVVPVVFVVSQDPAGTNPVAISAKIGPIETGSTSVTAILLGAFPLLELFLSTVGSVVAGIVLPGLLDGMFRKKLAKEISKRLADLPEMRVPDFVRIDFQLLRQRREAWYKVVSAEQTRADEAVVAAMEELARHPAADDAAANYRAARALAEARDAAARAASRVEAAAKELAESGNRPEVGRTRARANQTSDGGYLMTLGAQLAFQPHAAPVLHFPPGNAPAAASITLAMSHRYVQSAFAEVSDGFGYDGPVLNLLPGGRKANGDEVDWWADARDPSVLGPKPANLNQPPPSGTIIHPSNPNLPDWWAYRSVIRLYSDGMEIQPMVNAAPDSVFAEWKVRARIIVELTRYTAISYEVCDDATRLMVALEQVGRAGPNGPVRGPVEAQIRVRGRPAGPAAAGGGDGIPPEESEVVLGYDFVPLPDDPGQAQIPGVAICKWVTSWDVAERQTWLEADLEMRVPVYGGIGDKVNLPNGEIRFLPSWIFRFDRELGIPLGNHPIIKASGPLAGLAGGVNQTWLRDLMVQHLQVGLARGRSSGAHPPPDAALHFVYVANAGTVFEPEGFYPVVALALDPTININDRDRVDEDQRPRSIAVETFGVDPTQRNVAIGFHLIENILRHL